jgi:hypothetical protein
MGNVLPSNKDVHETYDLKGSTYGRITTDEDLRKNPHAVLKDLNWVNKKKRLELGPQKVSLFLDQLYKDVQVEVIMYTFFQALRYITVAVKARYHGL